MLIKKPFSLQEFGDCHQMLKSVKKLKCLHMIFYEHQEFAISRRIGECIKKITDQAQTHQTQGRYKDAEYLYRQLEATSASLDPSDDGLSKPELDMVSIYEKLGNLPVAETLQEHRLLFLMRPGQGTKDAIISREAENLFRLYIFFMARVEDLNGMSCCSQIAVLLTIFRRIAMLGCSILNAMLFKSELWTRCNPELCLHIAIRIRSTKMIRGLISIGVDINKGGYGRGPPMMMGWSPPLLTAARYGTRDILGLLLQKNVDVGAKSPRSETALHHAMLRDPKLRNETYGIIFRLIEAGVDVNAVDRSLSTALHCAVSYGPEPEETVVRCLIKAGVDIEAEDCNKKTALILAVERKYMTTVRLLLQQGANTEVTGRLGETLLCRAVRLADKSMAELLLDHGADIESQGWEGNTALHRAVFYKRIEMVSMLLERGASTAICNDLAQTPVDIARVRCNQIMVDMLLQ